MWHLFLLTIYLQYFAVTGRVLDAETRMPIANASIIVKGGTAKATSGADGSFELDNLSGSLQTLVVSHADYQNKEVAVSDLNESEIEILLLRGNEQPDNPKPNRPKNNNKNNSNNAAPDTLEVPLAFDSTGVGIEQVVIQAIRADERTPITETSITKTDIEKNYIGQDMPFLLLQTPSVTAYSDNGGYNGYTYIRLRGMDPTRINMTLNGAPLNEPEDQGAYFSNFVDFGNSLESIQVQRGTGTSTNGMASYAGSINFESMSLTRNKGGELQVGYGSYGSYRASAEYATGLLPNKLAFYSRFSLLGTNGYRYHSNNRSYSFFMSGGYFGEKDMLKITAFSGISLNQMAYLPTVLADIQNDPRTNYLLPDERDHFTQHYAQAQYVHSFSHKLDFSVTGYYSHIDGNYDLYAGGSSMLNLELLSHFAGGFATLKYSSKNIHFTGGIHGNYFQRRHRLAEKPFTSQYFYSNVGQKMEGSAFAKLRWDAGIMSLYVDMQGRFARFNYQPDVAMQGLDFQGINWWFANPKLGIQLRVHPMLTLYASGGMTEREPTRTDLLGAYDNIDSTNYAEVGDFTKVRPERVIDAELGLQLNHPRFHAQLNGYYMDFKNEIAAIGQLNFFSIPLRKNVASSFRAGAEFQFNWRIIKGLHINGNCVYNFHRIREYRTDFDSVTYTNVRPLLTPDFIGNLGIEYQPFAWWSLAVSGRYSHRSFLDNTNNLDFIVPFYAFGDFRTTFQIKNHRLSIAVNNFTNARYYMSGQVFGGLPAYYAQAPINFYVTYSFKF